MVLFPTCRDNRGLNDISCLICNKTLTKILDTETLVSFSVGEHIDKLEGYGTLMSFPTLLLKRLWLCCHFLSQWGLNLSVPLTSGKCFWGMGYVDRKPEATLFMVSEKSARGFSSLKGVARVTKSNVMIKGK